MSRTCVRRIASGDVDAEVALGNLYESGRRAAAGSGAGGRMVPACGGQGARRCPDESRHDVPRGPRRSRETCRRPSRGTRKPPIVETRSRVSALVRSTRPAPIACRATQRRPRCGIGRAAEPGLGTAQYRLGLLYRDGRGTPRDRTQAIDMVSQGGRSAVKRTPRSNSGILLSPGHGQSDRHRRGAHVVQPGGLALEGRSQAREGRAACATSSRRR